MRHILPGPWSVVPASRNTECRQPGGFGVAATGETASWGRVEHLDAAPRCAGAIAARSSLEALRPRAVGTTAGVALTPGRRRCDARFTGFIFIAHS